MKLAILSVVMCSMLVGCDTQVSFDNEGPVCAFASDSNPFITDTPQEFVADAPLELLVIMEGCVSSSCTSNIETSCEVSVNGSEITLTSRGSYEEAGGLQQSCTDDCLAVTATCVTPPLPAGAYTLVHGDSTMQIDVPASAPAAPCTEDPLF